MISLILFGVPPLARRDPEEIQLWAVRVKPDDPGEWEKRRRRLDVTGGAKSVTGMSHVVVSASQKRAVFPQQSLRAHKDPQSNNLFSTSSVVRGLLVKITPRMFTCAQGDSRGYRRAPSVTHFQKKSRHSMRSCSFDSVCPIIPHFFFPLPPAPSTLWKPLLRETKSVISLVVLMHQTFLISGIEKRAAQL